MARFNDELNTKPFKSYSEYMQYIFDCVNSALDVYISGLKVIYANGEGGYKNIMYPDIELAGDTCRNRLTESYKEGSEQTESSEPKPADKSDDDFGSDEDSDDLFGDAFDDMFSDDDEDEELDSSLLELLGDFASGNMDSEIATEDEDSGAVWDEIKKDSDLPIVNRLKVIDERARLTVEEGIDLPFYDLCSRLAFEPFTQFCFACGILSSTQTDYAGVFHIINENAGLSAPTIESAAKVFFGSAFSITGAFGDMSACLEQLKPVLPLQVIDSMPFSTIVSPDKRIIDYLFGRNPLTIDENFDRFIYMITDDSELDPVMANESRLNAMKTSYNDGVRIFYYYGDDGSGRKFFVKHFCREKGLRAIAIDCKKLFIYDFSFVEKALWSVTRECILSKSCCCLTELTYHDEEKEKFFGYMDLAFSKLTDKNILVFAMSKLYIDFREVTKSQFTDLELPTPDTGERLTCWEYFSKGFELADEIDLLEMSTKFLFTSGKIHDALIKAKSLSNMDNEEKISRANLFKGCYAQMSSELSQKATRVEAKFGFDDIVMNPTQRETIEHAIEQMTYRKQVYESWNYTRKYPYGRGLTVLLFGAPGTGKSMMAQVLAHELNLELYRVDISKVVDKYVGETEKSLSMIFREAKKCNVVLFFDECDTIFAKRSDDGGSNQASANNKTALLLQEMEAYDGVCVLATNYKHNIDPAFFRRMKYIVEFQFPDVDTREMLWRTTIPKDTPLCDDVDIRFLAEKYEFAGGNIKNCILNAAFLAAADPTANGEVCMRHYLNAIKYEFVKVGKVFTKSDFEPYAEDVGLA
ncbi:ATPase family associated with various cellular activities (AAA) [Lachnospiraceae bacterium XBB2008]|nr:ATPase family associated with various cellular activities (AAA) [Lachnospiraceae bacterium XBB2008]